MDLMLFIRTKILQLENETIALNGHIQVIFFAAYAVPFVQTVPCYKDRWRI